MIAIYELHVQSTGELIRRMESAKTLVSWHKWVERKLLRYLNTPERVKAAIRTGDTIAGWANYDACRAVMELDALSATHKRIFRGYDSWYEKRGERE